MRKWETLTYVPSLQDHLKRGLAPKHPKKTSSSIRLFLRLLLSVGAARREKNPSSLDHDIGRTSPSSPLIPPHSTSPPRIYIQVQQDREKLSSSGERREERKRNGLAMAMSATGDRLPVFATVAGTAYTRARMLRTHTLTHTYTQQHYACTPSLRFARGQSRRALSLSRAHTRSRTYVRTHARTHAYTSESVERRDACSVCSECIRGESAVALAARPANRVIGRRIHPSRSSCRASSRRAVCFKDLFALVFLLFFPFLLFFRLSSPFPSLLFSSLGFPSRPSARPSSSSLSTSCSVWLGRRSCSRRRSKRDRKAKGVLTGVARS